MNSNSIEEQLSDLFSYRAEELKEQIFELYTEPSYFPELKTGKPCVLMGGRGSGKTTALRGLSYEGQFALSSYNKSKIAEWNYYGIYYRVNTNRVAIFQGEELLPMQWAKLFAHYFNLIVCEKFIQFFLWYELHASSNTILSKEMLKNICSSLCLEECSSIQKLSEKLSESMILFEIYVNGAIGKKSPDLSVQGAPIDILLQSVTANPLFQGKTFLIIIDEYENFDVQQQQVVNTLIKHCGNLYSFKIGIKELGWKTRTTLNTSEQLISPADYELINIGKKFEGELFKRFAFDVCSTRLQKIGINEINEIPDLKELLPSLSEDEEAKILGMEKRSNEIRQEISTATGLDVQALSNVGDFMIYLFKYWELSGNGTCKSNYENYLLNPVEWETRLNNYKHAMLFTILGKKRGIRKYYCGWDVFMYLANGNIRYLLELVVKCLLLQVKESISLTKPISYKLQTKAVEQIGQKNLSELEGLSVDGARLTKLLLGLGRIFGIVASSPFGHAPETNQFSIREDLSESSVNLSSNIELDSLLNAAVTHMALIRFSGSKLQDESETKKYDYMIHPIFSAFFVISYRKKRKIQISESELFGLIFDHQKAIKKVLERFSASVEEELDNLPDQLSLFESYFKSQSE